MTKLLEKQFLFSKIWHYIFNTKELRTHPCVWFKSARRGMQGISNKNYKIIRTGTYHMLNNYIMWILLFLYYCSKNIFEKNYLLLKHLFY